MKTFAEVAEWMAGAADEFDDPATPVCQLFFRWMNDGNLLARNHELQAGLTLDGQLTLWLLPTMPVSVPIQTGRQTLWPLTGEVDVFGAELIAPGLWRMMPSLNVPGLIHAFIVLYDVPDPAPWEKRIIVVAA